MNRLTLRTSPYVMMLMVLLLVSCGRRSEERTAVASSTPVESVGTKGNATTPAAQTPDAQSPASQNGAPASRDGAAERDPAAIKALEDMGSYLRSLKAFQIR